MKRHALLLLLTALTCFSIQTPVFADEPDSVYLFSYASQRNSGRNGLHFAYSADRTNWKSVGPEYSFVKSDYGSWGSEKRMLQPYLFRTPDGMWQCIWSLNERGDEFAHAASADLINWKRQTYTKFENTNFELLEARPDKRGRYLITWRCSSDQKFYQCETSDFKTFSMLGEANASNRLNDRVEVELTTGKAIGQIHRVAWSEVEKLKEKVTMQAFWNARHDERIVDDGIRFKDLGNLEATLKVHTGQQKAISDKLIGIFFEDINYSADGGLYAELVQNRDFEYSIEDKGGRDANWNSKYAWEVKGPGSFSIETLNPIHPNNSHYAIVHAVEPGVGLVNAGFDGIPVKKGERYDFSVFTKHLEGATGALKVRLVGPKGEVYAETSVKAEKAWKKQSAVLTSNSDATSARLEVQLPRIGKVAIDMVSLFPQKTFKGRKNGLRADLAQVLADMHPKFVRFPGGCVAHGDGLKNIYRWKTTIGPLEARKPMRNIWNYHQTTGLGYHEYFQFCEDIGAEPLPVLAAGVPCQNSHTGGGGQQGGVPLCEMDEYVQEILDLVEWANGDAKTTRWGKIRAQNGHPAPFNLKYIGIGNEDLITNVFEERFTMIFKALKEKHPEITVIGTVGPFWEGSDYEEGWDLASKLGVPMVDEHYYLSPGWFINHQDYYDDYDRSKPKVYLGEYAAHLPGRPNNLETALAEALYLTNVERNGDVVAMTSYAPLLAKEGHTQWNPDLIYFNNVEIKPTTGYQVQKLFGQNAGDKYITSELSLKNRDENVRKRVSTSVVMDSKTGDLILKMVNLLPVHVTTIVTMDGDLKLQNQADCHVLTGKPEGLRLTPVSKVLPVDKEFPCVLPPYSLSVYRIKASQVKR